ncbi:MAG: hypothetical protein DMD45_05775 [Gemmatimonadetes bacterium]|nr:MAG: hypothetical protein DMD45_05775 [Gemmatimonadota bacterium]
MRQRPPSPETRSVGATRPPHRVVQRPLPDLLEVRVEREHDVEPRHRRRDHPRRRLVFTALAVLQDHRRSRPAGEQRVERLLEPRRAVPVVAQPPDGGVGEGGGGIEPVEHRFEVHAADAPQRLHLEPAVRPREVRVALAQRLLPRARREAEPARDERAVGGGIAQLIRRDADVIGLLAEAERRAVAIEQRATPRRQDDALGALRLRLLRPATTLPDLHLGGASGQECQPDKDADFHHLEPYGGLRH